MILVPLLLTLTWSVPALAEQQEIYTSLAVTDWEQRVQEIHHEAIVVDSHLDTMMQIVDDQNWLPNQDIGGVTALEADIPKLMEGGVDVGFFASYTKDHYGHPERSVSRTLALINALHWTADNNPDTFQLTSTSEEIATAVKEKKIAAVPAIEGAYSMTEENAIELLHQYRDLGIRVIGFNWNTSNALGEGANEVYDDPAKTPSSGGLTDLGEEVIKEMNRLGMVVDVSHMSDQTFYDVLDTTDSPVLATHSGARSVRDHQRNLTDDQLKRLADNGGVIGIVYFPLFLTENEEGYVEDIIDHIDHAVEIAGIDHVALGSDFDGAELPADMKDASETHKITESLLRRGYSEQDIKKILGENTLRVLEETERTLPLSEGQPVVHISPSFGMGEGLPGRKPLLSAEISADDDLDAADFKVVVDGSPHVAEYDRETSTISFQITEPLNERFHAATFEVRIPDSEPVRETRIFYIEQ